jgi:hypothetical protein
LIDKDLKKHPAVQHSVNFIGLRGLQQDGQKHLQHIYLAECIVYNTTVLTCAWFGQQNGVSQLGVPI